LTALFTQVTPSFCNSLGASWQGNVIHFALPVDKAESVEYFFYAKPYSWTAKSSISLLEHVVLAEKCRFGNIWSWKGTLDKGVRQEASPEECSLGYLIRITKAAKNGKLYTQWVIDPYARTSTGAEQWGTPSPFLIDSQDFSLTAMHNYRIATLCAASRNSKKPPSTITKSLENIVRRLPVISPKINRSHPISRPNHALEESIIYECHIRGMTRSFPLSNPEFAGTYRGLQECIPYLKELGITTIELLPIFDFDESENPLNSPEDGSALLNYWGYSTLLFFAPKQSYAQNRCNPIQELMDTIDAFHAANIEVILDVVYNHTAELDAYGPTDHFKALAPQQWYLQDADGILSNYSGCGNTLNCSHPLVKQMIIDSLSYWAHEVGVDGFRFDLTSILDRNAQGAVNAFPQFLWELKHNPAFSDIKFIAEPWDAAGAYQVGHFAFHIGWAEWNDRYRDSIRKSMLGQGGMMGALKNSLTGSPAVYQAVSQGRRYSINFLTAHDGFTLYDLVSYNQKHNDANGEENRDGMNENHSDNCGEEGASYNPEVQALRYRKLRMFHLLLQCSLGIPMLTAGDEIGRTQEGNNNAYALDNPDIWMPWDLETSNQALFQFVSSAIKFRKENYAFLFPKGAYYEWFSSSGEAVDYSPHVRTLVWKITNSFFPNQSICILINCYHDALPFCIPEQQQWDILFDTSQSQLYHAPFLKVCKNMMVPGFSMVLLSKNHKK